MIRVNVEINNKFWLSKIDNPKKYLSKKLRKIKKFIKPTNRKNLIFTILLTNSLNIKKLNKKFRNKNKPTDVLSFPSFDKKKIKHIKQKNFYLGDIAISYEIINLRSKKKSFTLEFDKAWIHGFLHLLGYDHIKNKDYFKMNRVEKKILNSIS